MPELPNPVPALLTAALDRLRGQAGVSPAYLDLRVDLFHAQVDALEAIPEKTVFDGEPLWAPALSGDVLPTLLNRVEATLVARDPGSALPALFKPFRAEPALARTWVGAASPFDQGTLQSLATRLDAPFEALLFFGRILAAPFVHAAIRAGARPPTKECAGACPACGSAPGLAWLEGEEGRLFLGCGVCAARWSAPRLACPTCGAEDKLVRLREEEDAPRWIQGCDACQAYIQIVDRRTRKDASPFLPLVEVIAGLYLDMIAEEEGYVRGLPYAALG